MSKIIVFISLLLAIVACGRQEVSTSVVRQEVDSAALKVAVMPTLDCLPLYLAAERGLFQGEGVKVQLLSYTSQMDCDTAVERRKAEGMVSDLVRSELMQRRGTRLHYVAATNLSWQLVSNKSARIKQASQLYDKKVAMTRFSATDLLTSHIVDSASLAHDHVYRIQMNDVVLRLNMLERGIIDALFLPEPQATQARKAGSPVVYDTRSGGYWLGVIAFREDAMNSRQPQIEAFVKAYNAACDSLNAKGLKHYRQLIERHCGVKPETVNALPTDIRFTHAQAPKEADIQTARQWLDKL